MLHGSIPQDQKGSLARALARRSFLVLVCCSFRHSGPWEGDLAQPTDIHDIPAFADIPHPGERIEAGRPILTFFSRASSCDGCLDTLKQIAHELNGWLFG